MMYWLLIYSLVTAAVFLMSATTALAIAGLIRLVRAVGRRIPSTSLHLPHSWTRAA